MTGFDNIFVDTAPYIYGLEHNDQYFDKIKAFFEECAIRGTQMTTSAITITEYCIIPCRESNRRLVTNFKKLLVDTGTRVINIDPEIAYKAAQIRAIYSGFKAMDALQLAAAVLSGCDCFLTNDRQLKQFADIPVHLIEDL